MTVKGFARNFKPLEILTEGQVEAIHQGTLDVLWETGITFMHDRTLKLFEQNGCKVDYDNKRARIPAYVVEECIRSCPSSYVTLARDPARSTRLGGNTVHCGYFPGMHAVNLETWEPRSATRKDHEDAARVIDALGNFHSGCGFGPYFTLEGVHPTMLMLEVIANSIRNTSKPCGTAYMFDSEVFTIQMAQATNQQVSSSLMASPPLTYYTEACEAAFRFTDAGFPLLVCGGGVFGASAPVTLAGAAVANNAELIAGVVLIQLIKPGTGTGVINYTFPADMRTGSPAFGSIGVSLHTAMFNQIFRHYGIPTTCAALTSSAKAMDYQTGYEKAIALVIAALTGANSLSFGGSVHDELSWSPVMAVVDNDILGMVGRFLEGVAINKDTLAIDLIEQVGPIPGHYLGTEHTRKWWKKEQFLPEVADRLSYPDWMAKGKKTAIDYAKARVEEILATHKPTPLTSSQEAEIEKILEEARSYYKQRGML
jgi:trimethylamine--corrinoid protein Co-methyltransferase